MRVYEENECSLEIILNDSNNVYCCDGCGKIFKDGEQVLTGIESCCGNCYRQLCRDCVAKAENLFKIVKK